LTGERGYATSGVPERERRGFRRTSCNHRASLEHTLLEGEPGIRRESRIRRKRSVIATQKNDQQQ
jgi:hypothetical protein